MRRIIFMFCLMVLPAASATAQVGVGVGVGLPGLSIGINVPVYPTLVLVPNYPVYYAPAGPSNYFFYDGVYWVFQSDNWYASSWYDGPWTFVSPDAVPLFILRIPVRYYLAPPAYFRRWRLDEPPRWGEHWGPQWEQHRRGWDRWNHSAVPAPAPLPSYQRAYSGNRYPRPEEQNVLRNEQYRYRPVDPTGRRVYQEPTRPMRPAPSLQGPGRAPQPRNPAQFEGQRSPQPPMQVQPRHPTAPAAQSPGPAPRPGPAQRQRQEPGANQPATTRGTRSPQGRGQGGGRDDQRGREGGGNTR